MKVELLLKSGYFAGQQRVELVPDGVFALGFNRAPASGWWDWPPD